MVQVYTALTWLGPGVGRGTSVTSLHLSDPPYSDTLIARMIALVAAALTPLDIRLIL